MPRKRGLSRRRNRRQRRSTDGGQFTADVILSLAYSTVVEVKVSDLHLPDRRPWRIARLSGTLAGRDQPGVVQFVLVSPVDTDESSASSRIMFSGRTKSGFSFRNTEKSMWPWNTKDTDICLKVTNICAYGDGGPSDTAGLRCIVDLRIHVVIGPEVFSAACPKVLEGRDVPTVSSLSSSLEAFHLS